MAGDHGQSARFATRTSRLIALLDDRGVADAEAVHSLAETSMRRHGLTNGQQIVARAWVDDGFRQRLLDDATEAVKELGHDMAKGFQPHLELRVPANSAQVHHLVVCTLCSCYPVAILGPPPPWYKYEAYRSRAVRDPRGLVASFGLEVPADKQIRVWDSSSEIRYMVLPERPEGTEQWAEADLAELVTQESIIGTGVARMPATNA